MTVMCVLTIPRPFDLTLPPQAVTWADQLAIRALVVVVEALLVVDMMTAVITETTDTEEDMMIVTDTMTETDILALTDMMNETVILALTVMTTAIVIVMTTVTVTETETPATIKPPESVN